MARRLTTFSKFLITLVILAAIVFGGRWVLYNTDFGRDLLQQAGQEVPPADESTPSERKRSGGVTEDETLVVQLFTWGGYAPGIYYNEGWDATTRSRFYKDYGLKVKFELIDDFNASRAAWKADEVALIGSTADALPTEMEGLMSYDPMVVMQVDWSRGGDALVAKRGINSINDLRGKKVAVTPSTPSQTFLIKLLDAANLELRDIEVQETSDNFAAAAAFKGGAVDAAVVWAPDDEACVQDVPGSKILESTANASHIIADVFVAKKEFVDNNKKKIAAFYEGWMKGAAEINASPSNKQKAAKIMAEGTDFDEELSLLSINKARLTNHGDNQNFFGLNRGYKGVTGEDLYEGMGRRFEELGFAKPSRPNWRAVAYTGAVKKADKNLTGPSHAAEGQKDFKPADETVKAKKAIASKPVTINFNTGAYQLTENAKTIIDLQFADIAQAFGNARIRIEGNTDNVGSRATNKKLSLQRAQSVAKYLESAYSMDPNRFILIGNGPDKPVPGCEKNATPECRAKNRRTEFQLIQDN